MDEISEAELVGVIADFIGMGRVKNIIAMFKENPTLYGLLGKLLQCENISVS